MAAISVIVVTYNQEATIGRALESVLCQEVSVPFEIVIGDDASTDGTSAICREYATRYPDIIRYHRRERNLGLVDNYFQCLRDCRGEFIADCAGDDFWIRKDKLQMQYDIISRHPDVALVHTAWMSCDEDGGNVRQSGNLISEAPAPGRSEKGSLTLSILSHRPEGFVHLCSALYKKTPVLKWMDIYPDLFDGKEYRCEDLQIITLLSAVGDIVYLPVVTLHYTESEESISHSRDFEKSYLQMESNLRLTETLRRILEIDRKEMKCYYDGTLGYTCSQAIYSGSRKLRRRYFQLRDFLGMENAKDCKRRIKEIILGNRLLWSMYRRISGKRKSL